ncbi:MAG: flagellar hook-associated protein FlgK [Halobacteriovoraceae bacterium]|nr:flagellar hook-associated protein FlgK [Halobacteriovoraceae bacterium]
MGSDLFSIGRTSLNASKKSLSTTSHNIANANTEGYSRQRVNLESATPIGEGNIVIGSGVSIKSVKRVHDQLVEENLNDALTKHQFNETRTSHLSSMEQIFNEINSDGLNKVMNRFFNSFRELSNQPENEVVRTLVRDNAQLVVEDFHRISEEITQVKSRMDKEIRASVEEINQLGTTITRLNKEIVRLENVGGETGDLRDQRDMAVRALSEFTEVKGYEAGRGEYVVNLVGWGSLVAGGSLNPLVARDVTGNKQSGSYSNEGRLEIAFEKSGKAASNLTEKKGSGSLGAIVKTRNEELEFLRDQLDEMAHSLVHITNAIHRKGFVNKKIPTDQQGNLIVRPGDPKITGINFFKEPLGKERASGNIAISDEVMDDLTNIATGLEPNSPGDNRIALAISKVQHEKLLGDGTKTIEEMYLETSSSIGLASSKAQINAEQSGGIVAQARSIKERISGVNLDEEATNMVKYQQAYQASAKMIRTADEMFDSVLEMIR